MADTTRQATGQVKKLIAATSTPLASIFGSGFLIIVPVLNGAVGKYAVFAMALVCLVAYCVGHAIRFNITNAEPLLENDTAAEKTKLLERSSDLALVAAYVISVCLYINILASFLLGGIGKQYDTDLNEHIISMIVISAIGLVGYFKGLDLLEKLHAAMHRRDHGRQVERSEAVLRPDRGRPVVHHVVRCASRVEPKKSAVKSRQLTVGS